jgi:maltooligosyltrehalose trehalohydrolase
VIATGESDGYYADYVRDPRDMLRRCLAEGFAYQGEPSTYRGGVRRGESSRDLRPTAFVSFLQNHDQVGNRLRSERLHSLVTDDAVLTALTALLLLAPAPPLLFMGEEWHADQPFPFFCDLEPTLAAAVRDGRKREFRRFHPFADPARAAAMPDPGAVETFESARLCWSTAAEPGHREWLRLYRRLLRLRHREIVPRLPGAEPGRPNPDAGKLLGVDWRLGDGSVLRLLANLSAAPAALPRRPAGRRLYSTQGRIARGHQTMLDAWTTLWLLERPRTPRAERTPSVARRRLQGCTG